MNKFLHVPLETWLADAWRRLDPATRNALWITCAISVLAFGFEMSNLTLHHDDVNQMFIEDTILGHYLGRFGVGWLYYYTQGAHIMPFLQMVQGIVLMAVYGLVVARFWGARSTADLTLVACIVSVFPYMAHIYQYNTTMPTYTAAHLLVAGAVVLSVQGGLVRLLMAALLYVGAFSIYQGVAANAVAIFVVWWLMRLLFPAEAGPDARLLPLRALGGAIAAALAGGILYFVAISFMTIQFDEYQSAEKALKPGAGIDLRAAVPAILAGTRSFYLWPEAYFPGFLKTLQLLFVVGTAAACVVLPRTWLARVTALLLLAVLCFSPRSLQLLHAAGHYHELTLTTYALVVAAAVLAVRRGTPMLLHNVAGLAAVVIVAGYVVQCAWISTVGQMNTMAHYTTMTQVLGRLRALPDGGWDGKRIVVVGEYAMPQGYPFRRATGVAPEFMRAHHMNLMAKLMRDEAVFEKATPAMTDVAAFVQSHPQWPHPASVGIVNGRGVVVLSSKPQQP